MAIWSMTGDTMEIDRDAHHLLQWSAYICVSLAEIKLGGPKLTNNNGMEQYWCTIHRTDYSSDQNKKLNNGAAAACPISSAELRSLFSGKQASVLKILHCTN